ncbi:MULTISPECIES: DUF4124 domain-containing protein [Cysteiniphilum]|uniref:DUF4124 domain-containing protein n=1 Tax=Cysteiniphilum TaxID=2056696 RepID=UPI00177D6E12|nr:DUF4124 domain-containing protein [Cysteiniphilum marinum]
MQVYTKAKSFCQHFLLLILVFYIFTANAEIYHWQDKNGNTVFSNTPPEENTNTTTVNTQTLNVIAKTNAKTDNEDDEDDINPPQAMTDILKEKLSEHIDNQKSTLNIKITSPANNTHIHNFYPLIPIQTSPPLSAKAKVMVIANEHEGSAVYQNNTWNIPRPFPGKNDISLYGKTETGETFFSDSITMYIHNSRVKQNAK